MVDRFGEDVTTLAYDMTSFRVQTEISASPTFFGWVFGFNGKVQILAPESVKEQYRQMIAKADEDMQESEQCSFEIVQTEKDAKAKLKKLADSMGQEIEQIEYQLIYWFIKQKNSDYQAILDTLKEIIEVQNIMEIIKFRLQL